MTEPEGPGPPRRAASPPGGGTVKEATASPTGIHPAPGCIPGVHSTVSLEAPRAELTGLELIDESTGQMPSNSIRAPLWHVYDRCRPGGTTDVGCFPLSPQGQMLETGVSAQQQDAPRVESRRTR